jgi:putative glutamine amidotransferase
MPVHIAIPEPTSPRFVDDSAAYNLRSLPQYLHSLISAGATPIPIPLHESPQRVAKILSTCHGILLPGSPADIDPQKYGEARNPHSADADAERAAVDELLIQDAFNLHKPILGICQGTQALNVWLGGDLIQDIPTQIGTAVDHAPGRVVLDAHPLQITPNTRLASIVKSCPRELGDVYVNSSHHQAIRTHGDNLVISARSAQDGVIEAVELASSEHFVLAVQWHPERTYNESALSRAIFAAFVHAAESWMPRRIEESVLHA